MVAKILAVVALVTLPLSAAMWHRSHRYPVQYRYDLTAYKSLWVSLKDGVCGLRVLTMPTKTAARSEFRHPLRFPAAPSQASLWFHSAPHGAYRTTWIVFPFWLPTLLLTLLSAVPVVQGPVRRLVRRWRGCCMVCGYDLTGNRSGRCPECGQDVHSTGRRPHRPHRAPVVSPRPGHSR